MFILGIKMNSLNSDQPMPVVLTGPKSCQKYFETLDRFIRKSLGESVARQYDIVINDPERVADICISEIQEVTQRRIALGVQFQLETSDRQHPAETFLCYSRKYVCTEFN